MTAKVNMNATQFMLNRHQKQMVIFTYFLCHNEFIACFIKDKTMNLNLTKTSSNVSSRQVAIASEWKRQEQQPHG